MTLSYHHQLASLSPLAIFRVLFRWKGSVWKLIYKELFVWTILFLAISFIYRSDYILNAKQKIILGNLAYYFDTRLEYIPITFILGFFVDTILSRWSNIITNLGYIESYALFISNCIHGNDENTKELRRTLVRYLCLTQIFIFRDISIQVQKRFPTIDSMVDAGILLKNEKDKLDLIKFQYNKYWIPIRWIHAIALNARKQEIITSDLLYWKLCAEVDKFRHSLQLLCNYDWVPIPLVYSQVVFLAVYVHFLICLISQQFIITDNSHTTYLDLIVPMMTVIQFVFFIGWLKVAQALLNPFGDDDDDFECNYLIDKNLTQSFCIADNYDRVPDIRPDLFWRSQKVLPTSGNTLLNGSTVDFKTTKHNRPTQTANPEKTMQKITWNHYDHFEEQINRSSIQLKQYSKSNTDYYVLPNPNKNNKMKITRL